MHELSERIRRREARCGVIGLGYVGLPLALEFARAGFHVTGIDVDGAKIDAINGGRSYVVDLEDREITEQVDAGRLTATSDFAVRSEEHTSELQSHLNLVCRLLLE